MSNAIQEFSRFAHEYNTYNVIQSKVAASLVALVPPSHYDTIIDIGCGSGEVYKNIEKSDCSFKHFIALDSSEEMLALHPLDRKLKTKCIDFNKPNMFEGFNLKDDSLVLSSSALQWSKDLDFTLSQIAKQASRAYFAIFTSNTFKTLHQTAQLSSPIYTDIQLKEVIEKYYDAKFELKTYQLSFDNVRDMFHYIKKSGVSGGEKQLTYREIKHLMRTYPLDYLEFEVLFVQAVSL